MIISVLTTAKAIQAITTEHFIFTNIAIRNPFALVQAMEEFDFLKVTDVLTLIMFYMYNFFLFISG